jgi:hypothetical protein
VLGLTAGVVIRYPEALADPSILLPADPPDSCVEVIEAAEELAAITDGYLSLIRDTYLPMLEQQSGEVTGRVTADPLDASPLPDVGKMLAAEQRLADLGDRTTAAAATLHEAKVLCRSQARE